MFDFCFPHASGGVSTFSLGRVTSKKFSPREWGCFSYKPFLHQHNPVFPTRVGVFLTPKEKRDENESFPHASGGVSNIMPYKRTS